MPYGRISTLAARPAVGVVLRYGAAVSFVAAALGIALTLREYPLPHPFMAFSLVAIAITFWFAGTGPGLLALLFSCLALRYFGVAVTVNAYSSESYLIVFASFSLLVGWLSTSRRRAERLLKEDREHLEVRVTERTAELTQANVELQVACELYSNAEGELRREKDRLKLLLDLNNTIASNLDLRELFRAISSSVRSVMKCDYTGVILPEAEGKQLRVYARNFSTAGGLQREEIVLPAEGTPAGRVLASGQPLLLAAGGLAELNPQNNPSLAGMQSGCFLPLISRNRVLGTLNLARMAEIGFSQEDLGFLRQVANQVAIAVENALAFGEIAELKDRLAQEKLYLEDEIRTEANFEEIVGTSAPLLSVLKQVETVAPTDSTVLIFGETGTGKELIARAIHNLSPRREKTFVKLNCAAIPTGLLESELFGHEKGAFTGAIAQRVGRLELANHGTLFLDEIGDIPLELQPKLLRVLQEREFERLGSTRTLRTDVRLIAATNRDLAAMVDEQKFRSDLFFRLNVFPIQVPSLRERAEDIPLLVRHFAAEFSRRMNRTIETIPSEAMKALCQYRWPGNIRELQNVIERAVILSPGPSLSVRVGELQPYTTHVPAGEGAFARPAKRMPVRSILAEVNRDQIIRALKEAGGRVGGPTGAATRLGLKRTTFITRMKKLGIDPNRLSEGEGAAADAPGSSGTSIQ
jgi:formate hydrogenlyase transcriptional activator